MIGDRERCLQAGMVRLIFLPYEPNVDVRIYCIRTITLRVRPICSAFRRLNTDISLEPLRRADLLNAINKLAGERGSQKIQHLMRRPLGGAAYNGNYNGSAGYGGSYNLTSY